MAIVFVPRDNVASLLSSLNGAIFRAVYASRQTGEEKSGLYTTNIRKSGRTGKGLAYDPTAKALTQVMDVVASRRIKTRGGSADRMLPWEGIRLIRTNGTEYIITDDTHPEECFCQTCDPDIWREGK